MAVEKQPVTLRDIDVPFWRIVVIMIKWAIAAVPAAIVLTILYVLVAWAIISLFAGLAELTGLDTSNIPSSPVGGLTAPGQ